MASRVHLFEQITFLIFEALYVGYDITHLILTLTFGSSDTLRGIYPLSEFTFFGLVTTTFASFTYLPPILNQLILLCSLFCN